MANLFRQIPAVDKLLEAPEIKAAAAGLPRSEVAAVIRQELEAIRAEIGRDQRELPPAEITARVACQLQSCRLSRFQPVINATGVLIHTNIGRAPLPKQALQRLEELGRGYFNLELDLAAGTRGSRCAGAARLFNLLLGDESGKNDTIVVNNNAAAVLLVLKALTAGAEVIVSRGQLVEIGGGFRVPEVMEASGCRLVEVGTTNRTRLSDYARAITPQTKAILLVHPSNYTILGFTEAVPREELARLAEEHGLLLDRRS
jgi:L-seryl-tRNA(Ser) seleniumtransferase